MTATTSTLAGITAWGLGAWAQVTARASADEVRIMVADRYDDGHSDLFDALAEVRSAAWEHQPAPGWRFQLAQPFPQPLRDLLDLVVLAGIRCAAPVTLHCDPSPGPVPTWTWSPARPASIEYHQAITRPDGVSGGRVETAGLADGAMWLPDADLTDQEARALVGFRAKAKTAVYDLRLDVGLARDLLIDARDALRAAAHSATNARVDA
jgi:hypothetical protein